MVRTLPYGSGNRFELSRVFGYTAAIAIHALALMLLLIPMTAPQPSSETEEIIKPIWQIPEIVPITKTPPVADPTKTTKATPKPDTQTKAVPTPTPLPVDNANVVDPTPLVIDSQPTDSGPVEPVAGPVSLSSLSYVKATPPPYPRPEMTAGVQGKVVLRVLVGTDGIPLEVSIETSSGNRALDQSALRHVKKAWRFQPAMKDGQAVQAYGMVPIVFSLQ